MTYDIPGFARRLGLIGLALALGLGTAAPLAAQDTVTLRSRTGIDIVGTSVTLEGGAYRIVTGLGELLVSADDVECIGAGCPSLGGEERGERPVVTLRGIEDDYSIVGRLVALERGAYLLETPLGELRLDAEKVRCEGDGCPEISDEPRFTVHASGPALDRLMPELLKGYAEELGGTLELADGSATVTGPDGAVVTQVSLRDVDADAVVEGLAEGAYDIGLMQRRITPEEAERLAGDGFTDVRGGQNERLMALDGIAVTVHPSNRIRSLSQPQLRAIWSGEITNWRELGGADAPITVHGYSDSAALEPSDFRRVILATTSAVETPGAVRHEAAADVAEAVAGDRSGIGVVSRATATDADLRLLSLTRGCGLLAEPSTFSIKIGDYPATRPIYAYANPRALQPSARDFLEWTETVEAQQIIADAGFASAELESTGLEDLGMMLVHNAVAEPEFDGAQFQQVMRELRRADRLSLAFRFRPGSTILDADSIANLGDLADMIEAGDFGQRELLLVGFTDSVGPSINNTALGARRADAVLDILRGEIAPDVLARTTLQPISFGEQLPMACNDENSGRDRNRRVEVWTRLPS